MGKEIWGRQLTTRGVKLGSQNGVTLATQNEPKLGGAPNSISPRRLGDRIHHSVRHQPGVQQRLPCPWLSKISMPLGAESDKHPFPESCLQDDWTDDYAKSEAFAAEYRAVTDPDDGQKWPKGLTEEDGKLYRNGKLLVPESRVLELCEAWHHHMLHPGVKKQALDMQRRFEIDHIVLYTAIKKVRKGCSVCQACNPDNPNVKRGSPMDPGS